MRNMKRVSLALVLVCLCAAPAAAVDREHQQIIADVRMLQEQAQQLQALLVGLGDALKAVNARMDDQTALERKAFADGKVQLKTDLLMDPLRKEPRFQAIERELKFPS